MKKLLLFLCLLLSAAAIPIAAAIPSPLYYKGTDIKDGKNASGNGHQNEVDGCDEESFTWYPTQKCFVYGGLNGSMDGIIHSGYSGTVSVSDGTYWYCPAKDDKSGIISPGLNTKRAFAKVQDISGKQNARQNTYANATGTVWIVIDYNDENNPTIELTNSKPDYCMGGGIVTPPETEKWQFVYDGSSYNLTESYSGSTTFTLTQNITIAADNGFYIYNTKTKKRYINDSFAPNTAGIYLSESSDGKMTTGNHNYTFTNITFDADNYNLYIEGTDKGESKAGWYLRYAGGLHKMSPVEGTDNYAVTLPSVSAGVDFTFTHYFNDYDEVDWGAYNNQNVTITLDGDTKMAITKDDPIPFQLQKTANNVTITFINGSTYHYVSAKVKHAWNLLFEGDEKPIPFIENANGDFVCEVSDAISASKGFRIYDGNLKEYYCYYNPIEPNASITLTSELSLIVNNEIWMKFDKDVKSGSKFTLTESNNAVSLKFAGKYDDEPEASPWVFILNGEEYPLTVADGSDNVFETTAIDKILSTDKFVVKNTDTKKYHYNTNTAKVTLGNAMACSGYTDSKDLHLNVDADVDKISFTYNTQWSQSLLIEGTDITVIEPTPEHEWYLHFQGEEPILLEGNGEGEFVYTTTEPISDTKHFRIVDDKQQLNYSYEGNVVALGEQNGLIQSNYWMNLDKSVDNATFTLRVSEDSVALEITGEYSVIVPETSPWVFVLNNTEYPLTAVEGTENVFKTTDVEKILTSDTFYVKNTTTEKYHYNANTKVATLGSVINFVAQNDEGSVSLNVDADIDTITFTISQYNQQLLITGTEFVASHDFYISFSDDESSKIHLTKVDDVYVYEEEIIIPASKSFRIVDEEHNVSYSYDGAVIVNEAMNLSSDASDMYFDKEFKATKFALSVDGNEVTLTISGYHTELGEPEKSTWQIVVNDNEPIYFYTVPGNEKVFETTEIKEILASDSFYLKNTADADEKYYYSFLSPELGSELSMFGYNYVGSMTLGIHANIDKISLTIGEFRKLLIEGTEIEEDDVWAFVNNDNETLLVRDENADGEWYSAMVTNIDPSVRSYFTKNGKRYAAYGFRDGVGFQINEDNWATLLIESKSALIKINTTKANNEKIYTAYISLPHNISLSSKGDLLIAGYHSFDFELSHGEELTEDDVAKFKVEVVPHADFASILETQTFINNPVVVGTPTHVENGLTSVSLSIPVAGVYTVKVTDHNGLESAEAHYRVRPNAASLGLTINGRSCEPMEGAPEGIYACVFHSDEVVDGYHPYKEGSDEFDHEHWTSNHAFIDTENVHLSDRENIKIWFKPSNNDNIMELVNYAAAADNVLNETVDVAGYTPYDYNHSLDLAAIVNSNDPTVSMIVEQNGVRSNPMTVGFTHNTETGIVGVGAEDAEAIYYDLQGNRVVNPDKGIYIMVVGAKATKVVR